MFTNTYGISPSNTTLTVRYLTGGGVESNVDANTITTFENKLSICLYNSSILSSSFLHDPTIEIKDIEIFYIQNMK